MSDCLGLQAVPSSLQRQRHNVMLPKAFGAHCVPSLCAWFNHHRYSVQILLRELLADKRELDVALALFAKPGSCLTAITLGATCAPAL